MAEPESESAHPFDSFGSTERVDSHIYAAFLLLVGNVVDSGVK